MASTDDTVETTPTAADAQEAPAPRRRRRATSTGTAPEATAAAPGEDAAGPEPTDAEAPAAPPTRAPRKRAAKKAVPAKEAEAPAAEPGAAAEDTPPADAPAADEKARKRTRKAAKKAEPEPVLPLDEELGEPATDEEEDEDATEGPIAVPSLSLLFQAPDLSAAPARRRATRPASPPVLAEDGAAGEETGTTADADSEPDHADSEPSEGRGRRRRRGGRGRRARGGPDADRGDEQDAEDVAEEPAAAADTEDTTGPDRDDEGAEGGSAGSRRRRRRRRSGSAGEQEDPPGTVTKVRQPRAKDEVTGVKGSTRLEAKKQRRREGREAGRRRTVITEAEFLARRESVERVMVVRGREDRTQIAVLEDGVLVEHYVSRETNVSMAGNVYLGRVQNVLPSMEAAFVDIGRGRNAVLYAGEVNWDAAGLEGNAPKRIENALSSGDTVLVQVTKDPIGHKGARLTSQVSLPGRFLVYVPEGSMTGISRKLPDTERARLKAILKEVVPDHAGVIVRTAAEGASEEELRADVERLTQMWERIRTKAETAKAKKSGSGGAPVLLHGEPDLTVRVIRDIFNEDFSRLVVSGERAWNEVEAYVGDVAPDLVGRLSRWTGERDVFSEHRIDEQLAKAMDRKVWLPSGGSLVIDRTEAMTVVDVNTGKFVGSGGNLEETVTKNNIEAAEEIVRQLRLRDLGGIIVIDFIDMVLESNRDLVVRRLLECLGRDRTKHQVAEVTSLGLVQMTRKRVGSGLIEVFSEQCDHCNGRGIIIHDEPVERSGDNGAAAPQGAGRSARRGGRSGSGRDGSTAAPAPAAEPQESRTPSGPTAAQIAAAAHAAALKAATPEPGAEGGAPEHEAAPTADETVVPVLTDEDLATPAQPVEPPAEALPAPDEPLHEAPPDTVVVPRRRKRGRVVAPAGPPARAGAGGEAAPEVG